MYGKLQGVIQIFIRVIFRGIGRQEKHLNFLPVLLRPGRNNLTMMNPQIIQNQKYFLLRTADQTLHETDHPLLVHGILVDHKADIALVADGRDHIDPLPLRLYRQHGKAALKRKTALYDFTVAYPCLICPIDDAILCFCTPCNRRILLIFSPLDALRILPPRTLRRALATHSPALHVV